MRLNPTEIRILELFINDISLSISINAAAQKAAKHYRVVRTNVLSLISKGLIKSVDIAGAKMISLNIKNPEFPAYMAYVEEPYAYDSLKKHLPQITDIAAKAREISPAFVIGVFGSYADNTFTKKSDIDLFILCPDNKQKPFSNMLRYFPAVEDMIHLNIFSFQEFSEGIKQKGVNVYKEILKNKMLLSGSSIFYNLTAEND